MSTLSHGQKTNYFQCSQASCWNGDSKDIEMSEHCKGSIMYNAILTHQANGKPTMVHMVVLLPGSCKYLGEEL